MAGEQKKFVTGKVMSFTNQIVMDLPQLQRFDLIFVLLDEADYDRDRDIAMSILGSGANTLSSVDLPFVQRYIALSKKVEPAFTEEARKYIADRHAKKREADEGDYMRSHRLVPALQRLALATARFDFSDTVTLEHVQYAETVCAASINEEDPGLLTGAVDKQSRQKREATIRLVKQLMDSKSNTQILMGIETKIIKDHLLQEDIKYDNASDLNVALRSLPFLSPSGSKWIYEKED